MEEIITLETYKLSFQIKRSRLIYYLNKHFNGISLEEFISTYTWDEADYIRDIMR